MAHCPKHWHDMQVHSALRYLHHAVLHVLNIDSLPQFLTKSNLTSSHVYSSNIFLKVVTRNINVPMFCKVVYRYILPKTMFASLSKGFQELDEIFVWKLNNPYYIIL